ncbi:TPA: oligosaccharide flippase family protein [Proteus mirabilis]|nr:oligosaccharide flippase family protein [Proteus mirabilis]HEJ9421309.1 oligosaccharide flippase family protein [Proteus mirabilis]HEK1204576.1 oligosaccharide flippase family protein [Proteus mirabilis]HEK3153520.1 oligosaccharide flippase family protein [Proteus mirabilis]
MSLKKNIISLFSSQVIGYVVPLVQLPYLTRTLGAEYLGLYLFSLSMVTLASIITNYGFDISVTKKVAEGENTLKHLKQLLSRVHIIQSVLFIISTFIIIISIFYSQHFSNKNNLIILIIVAILGNTYKANWLFQSLEKIYIFSRITIIVKIFSLILIFIFIKNAQDITLLFLIIALQNILSTIISYFIIFSYLNITYTRITLCSVWRLFIESSEYFFSRLGVSLYSTLGGFFLGMFSSMHQVAIYSVAEQLYKAGVYAISSISTPLIPYMARTKNFNVFFKVTLLSLILTICGATIGVIFGNDIILILFGEKLLDANSILQIFMITIVISIIGIHFGYPALIPLGRQKIANYSVIYGGLLQLTYIGILLITGTSINAFNIALGYLFCDLLMTIIRCCCFIKNSRDVKW